MKIVLDLQSYQGASKNRGIGKYAISLTKSLLKVGKNHEFFIILNDYFIDSIEPIKNELKDLIDPKKIIAFTPIVPSAYVKNEYPHRRKISKLIREYVIAKLNPDIVHTFSIFEGYFDNVVVSVKDLYEDSTDSCVVYDLIPLIYQDTYLKEGEFKDWYFEHMEYIKREDIVFAISDTTKKDIVKYINIEESKIKTIYGGVDNIKNVTQDKINEVLNKFGITKPFIFYAPGSFELRKNIERLIESYIILPNAIKDNYQLVISGKIPVEYENKHFNKNIIFTNYVDESELSALYASAELFVMPSLYEGFGLSILEAMNYGLPVIGADSSSIKEIIQNEDALFDPQNPNSISSKIKQVLTDEDFKNRLKEYSLKRVKDFSWDKSAKLVLEAFEEIYQNKKKVNNVEKKPKLAYISPIPPAKTGIAYYSKELVPYLSEYYDIDIITDQEQADISFKSLEYFRNNFREYDRVLYHIGNSPFHDYVPEMLEEIPGVLVLHDFYLGDLWRYKDVNQGNGLFVNELYKSHGYKALLDLKQNGIDYVVKNYPMNLNLIQNALSTVVHSKYAKDLVKDFYSEPENIFVIKLFREYKAIEKKAKDGFLLCSFGILGPGKLNDKIIEGFAKSSLAKKEDVKLIFVGAYSDKHYETYISDLIKRLNLEGKVEVTGWVSDNIYQEYLKTCDMAIQLRVNSRGESSRALLDCMSYGIPTITNKHGTNKELPDDCVYVLREDPSAEDIAFSIENIFHDKELQKSLNKNAKNYIKTELSPKKIAGEYKDIIEFTYKYPYEKFLDKIVLNIRDIPFEDELKLISEHISKNLKPNVVQKRLFVDVSALARVDIKTGIQRVVKAQLLNLFQNPPKGYRIEPIYIDFWYDEWVYKYAREFTSKFLNLDLDLKDEVVNFFEGDILYLPDLYYDITKATREGFYDKIKAKNVKIISFVYDLLPIEFPNYFPLNTSDIHKEWIESIVRFSDKIICDSKSVADELIDYIHENNLREDVEITYIHLGSDIDSAKHIEGIKDEELKALDKIRQNPYFLMVSTIEPRKGHRQVLKAFEKLWKEGYNFNLVFVGKEGWMMGDFIYYISKHPEKNKRFFYLGQVSDDMLEHLYKDASATIMASEGEGFGIPIVESAYHKIPIIARDIPVFREVAKEGAYYFENTKDENVLAKAILDWYELYKQNKHPKPDSVKIMSWEEHTEILKNIILS